MRRSTRERYNGADDEEAYGRRSLKLRINLCGSSDLGEFRHRFFAESTDEADRVRVPGSRPTLSIPMPTAGIRHLTCVDFGAGCGPRQRREALRRAWFPGRPSSSRDVLVAVCGLPAAWRLFGRFRMAGGRAAERFGRTRYRLSCGNVIVRRQGFEPRTR